VRIPAQITHLYRALDRFAHWLVVFATAGICAATLYFQWRPPIGTYVVLLAVAAGLMTVRPLQTRAFEKGIWVVFLIVMGALEISNLYRDRDRHDADQRKYDAEQRALRESEFNNFKVLMGRFDEESRLINDYRDSVSTLAVLRQRQVTIRESPTGNLKERAQVLSHDILKYLVEHTGGGGMLFGGGTFGSSTFGGGGGESVVVGYSQSFRDRVIQIRNEFADFHLKDSELDTLMANPRNVPNIRKVAERITALAEKLK
jgi:hypothetical protein